MTEQGLYDIYGCWHVPWWQTNFFSYTIGVLICLFVGFALFLIIYAKRKEKVTPFEYAIQQLELLKNMVNRQGVTLTYDQLSAIIKHYLYQQKGYSKSLSDQELKAALHQLNITPDLEMAMQELLEHAVQAKFAKEHFNGGFITKDIVHAIEFIDHTKPDQSSLPKK